MQILMHIGLVALGSAVGGVLRFGVGELVLFLFPVHPDSWAKTFPWGTFFINITGSLFLGWFYYFTERQLPDLEWRTNLRLLFAVGVAGGYTTFSSFALEADRLIEHGAWLKSAAYIAGSVFLGLIALRLGVILARMG
jgi:CrcB protein